MHIVAVVLLSLGTSSVTIEALSLLDALRQANASIFAEQIQNDPNISALYLENNVKTVFAPVDFIGNTNLSLHRLRVRAPGQQFDNQYQMARELARTDDMNTRPRGKNIQTEKKSDLLNGDNRQNVVSHPTEDNNNNGSNNTGSIVRRQGNPYIPAIPPQRIKISSGLGTNVSIIRGDIPYDGGIIHLVDG